jgi:hypothetical protein
MFSPASQNPIPASAIFLSGQFAPLSELLSPLAAERDVWRQRFDCVVCSAHVASRYAGFTSQPPQDCESVHAFSLHRVGASSRILEGEDEAFYFLMGTANESWNRELHAPRLSAYALGLELKTNRDR